MSNPAEVFDDWVLSMELIGLSKETHYHPLLQIAVKMRERIAELEERQNKVLSLLEGCNLTYSRLSTVARIEECIHTLSPQPGDRE